MGQLRFAKGDIVETLRTRIRGNGGRAGLGVPLGFQGAHSAFQLAITVHLALGLLHKALRAEIGIYAGEVTPLRPGMQTDQAEAD